MIITRQITTKLDLMAHIDFVYHALAKVCEVDHTLEKIKENFDTIRANIENPETGLWIQFQGSKPLALALATIVIDLAGVRTCWLANVYSTPGADINKALNEVVLGWAKERGASRMQTASSNSNIPEKLRDRWQNRYGFRRAFVVYERKI